MPIGGFMKRKISELITWTLPGSPMTDGMSKASMPTMIRMVAIDRMVGSRNGKDTRHIVCQMLAPEMIAASSWVGSMLRRTGENISTAVGTVANPCTNTMPGRL